MDKTMWESDQPCSRCGALMVTDGKMLYCECGYKQPFPQISYREPLPHRSKRKWAWRTAKNIREEEQ